MKKLFTLFFAFFLTGIFLSGCSELKEDLAPAPDLSVHKPGILDEDSPNFHAVLIENSQNGWQDCQQCHAADFSGGVVGSGCNITGCHTAINVHADGINDTASVNFHGKFIANIGWELSECSSCHSNDYSGGRVSPSCLTCHTGEDGPEACNTCHGDFTDPSRIAPPRDLEGNIETSSQGVGAHVIHLYENNLGNDIRCSTCHTFPASFEAAGHIDGDNQAELNFGNLAVFNNGSSASYDYSSATCSNTYCHGNFVFARDSSVNQFAYTDSVMTGNNVPVIWNLVDGTQAECGTCHNLPPTGHIPVEFPVSCVSCHPGVVDVDGNIIDSTKHINGVINVFGN
ncbi:MAG: hypothetical protein Kow0098_25280 [Ignavibacteriaceae bacterium]